MQEGKISTPHCVKAGNSSGTRHLIKTAFLIGLFFALNFLLLVSPASAAVPATFDPAVNYGAGTSPHSATTGDFDEDGFADIAVANGVSDNVSILLGMGDGTFAGAENYVVGDGPYQVTTGDFNEDGNIDLATANTASNNVSILIGVGDGTFLAAVGYSVSAWWPVSVTTGDFNEDGNTDLATANSGDANVSILLGAGGGTFLAASTYSAGIGSYSVTTGDFNNDGNADLAVADPGFGSMEFAILPGAGNGIFGTAVIQEAGTSPDSIATGFFNADGNVDLAVANAGSNNITTMMGAGDGTFGSKVNRFTGAGPSSVTTGDFNLDGATDLAVSNQGSDNVSILTGNGDGTFDAAANFGAGDAPVSVSTGDFNNDGKADLALANQDSNNISVLLNSTPDAAKAITAFTISGQSGTTTIDESGHTVALTTPYGTDMTALVPTITHSGASVNPASGTAHDFTTPQTYTVTATDASTQDYTVTVTMSEAIFYAKWVALSEAPGAATSAAIAITGGMYKDYVNGRLYWNQAADEVYWVHGGILVKYDQEGRETGELGLPVSDESGVTGVTGARESDFTGGMMYWGPATGTWCMMAGPMKDKYLLDGGPAAFGLPISDEYPAWDGVAQNLQNAIMTWNSSLGAHWVKAGVMGKYQLMGGPTGALHLIEREEQPLVGVPDASEAVDAVFQNGRVYWSLGTGAHTVNGGIYVRYTMFGGPTSALGLPITDEYPLALPGGAARNRFQHGFITWWAPYGTWVDVI